MFPFVKSVQIRSFLWSVFSCVRTEYGDLRSKSLYSVQIQEITDQKKLLIWILFKQCQTGYGSFTLGRDLSRYHEDYYHIFDLFY